MIKVYTSSVIDAPADAVWAQVRDFNGLPQWTPFALESRIEEGQPADRIGCVRNFRLRDGGVGADASRCGRERHRIGSYAQRTEL